MAESAKNNEKLSMTSDLGSSSCENDADLSSDAKDQSDDVLSVTGSTSLTIDSLEEEDGREQRSSELPITSILQSEMLRISCGKDSSSQHRPRERAATDGSKDKHRVSDLIVTRNISSSDSSSITSVSDKQKAKCANDPEKKLRQGGDIQTEKRQQTNKKSPHVASEGSRTAAEPHNLCSESTTLCAKSDQPSQTVSVDSEDKKLTLRKSRSLTDATSTDPSSTTASSPNKATKRTGIPRRKTSTHSMVTMTSSGRSTPQNDGTPQTFSPTRLRRSMTLDCASGDGNCAVEEASGGSTPLSSEESKSFPCSPVKSAGKLRRSASQCMYSSGVTCSPLVLSRDNITSRLRFEKHHQDHGGPAHDDFHGAAYLTPSQRKDLELRQLRTQVKDLTRRLEDKDREVVKLRERASQQKTDQKLFEELEAAQSSAEAARKEVTSLQQSHTESVKKVSVLQQQLDDLKKDMRAKLAESENIFLEMYNKGRQSAIFEHEEEMEVKSKGGRSQESTEKELYDKLVKAQAELAKWQTITRHESYSTMPIPGTEAETTLRFLKDSVFHYLTTDKTASDEHLRAIVRILHFSESQRESIARAIIFRRNKTGW